MPDSPDKLSQFWLELKRRKVVRVITVYAAAAFVILELVSIIVEPLRLPEWTLPLIIVLLCIGFVIAVILSWIYDVTPEGIQKTDPISKQVKERATKRTTGTIGWRIATYISIVIIGGLVLLNVLNTRRVIDLTGLEETIAVLPFENLGQEGPESTLHNSLPIALIAELQNVEGFIIRPWGSTRNYRETDKRSTEIGNELRVNYLLKGFLLQLGSEIEVDIMLIKAASDKIIWNDLYKRETEDVLHVRRDISKQVASALKNSFEPESQNLSDNPHAEQAFFTGLYHYWNDEREQDFRLSIRYLERAVELDPGFILAWVKLSSAHSWMYQFNFDRTQDRMMQAWKTLEKAKEIDPGNPDVLLAEGIYYYVTHDYKKALYRYLMAEGEVTDAPELNMSLGSLYRRQQNLEKALEHYLIADELSPQNRIFNLELGETYLFLRNYEQSEEYVNKYVLMGGTHDAGLVDNVYLYLLWEEGNEKSRQALEDLTELTGGRPNGLLIHHKVRIELIDRNYEDALQALILEPADSIRHQFIYRPKSLYYAEVYALQKKAEQADHYYDSSRSHLEAKIAASPQDHRYHSSLGIAYAGLGRKEEAIREGKSGVDLMPITKDFYRGIFRLEDLARIYVMVEEYDMAIEILDMLLSMPGLISVNLLKKDPAWNPLRDHPGFIRLIEQYPMKKI